MSGAIIDPATHAAAMRAFRGTDLEHMQRQINPLDTTQHGPGQVNPVEAFANALESKVDQVNETMGKADDQVDLYVRGKEVAVHDVMMAMTKADINFKLLTSVGRKVVEAYQEIMRMQV